MTRTDCDMTQLIPNNPKHYKKSQNIIKKEKEKRKTLTLVTNWGF
jgi:hypothetical protein